MKVAVESKYQVRVRWKSGGGYTVDKPSALVAIAYARDIVENSVSKLSSVEVLQHTTTKWSYEESGN